MKTKEKSWIQSLFAYAEGEKKKMLLSVLLSIVSVSAGLVPFYCMYRIICLFVAETATASAIVGWCLWALLAYAVKIVTFTLSTGVSHNMAYHVLEGVRLRLADRFLHAPLGNVENHTIGEIKSMMVDKIENLEPPLAHMIPEGAGHVVLPIVSIIALLCIDWRLALASLVTFPLSMVCMMLTMTISGKNFQKYDQSNAYMNSTIVEYVEGIEVIKAFGRAGVSYEKYAKAITDFRTFVVKWLSSTYLTMKLSFALFPSTLIGTLPVALALANNGTITAPLAALAVMLSISMVGSLAKLEVFSENMRQVEFTVKGLQEFLEMPELPEPKNRAVVPSAGVELKNVHFSYTDNAEDEVLHGVDLSLPQGSFTALVGPSGGGKSTVAKLIARFWDVTSGSIEIGGVSVKDMPLSQLSEYVSFVTQDNFLFRCSLLENIRLGNPSATDEEVKAAARAAQCEEFIQKLPLGYDTPAGEAGKRLSGGEKQRIAIARMMLKNAPIVILDEATAFTGKRGQDSAEHCRADPRQDAAGHRSPAFHHQKRRQHRGAQGRRHCGRGHTGAASGNLPAVPGYVAGSHRREELGGLVRGKGGVRHVQDIQAHHRLVRQIQGTAVRRVCLFVLFSHFRGPAADGGGLYGRSADRRAENRRGV